MNENRIGLILLALCLAVAILHTSVSRRRDRVRTLFGGTQAFLVCGHDRVYCQTERNTPCTQAFELRKSQHFEMLKC